MAKITSGLWSPSKSAMLISAVEILGALVMRTAALEKEKFEEVGYVFVRASKVVPLPSRMSRFPSRSKSATQGRPDMIFGSNSSWTDPFQEKEREFEDAAVFSRIVMALVAFARR